MRPQSFYSDVWAPPPAIATAECPSYVAVIGNSGSGKSTIVRRLAEDVFPDSEWVAIDERDTHHPFLDSLFNDPDNYSYELQINFMIQRVLIVKRWLSAGVNVVMERSHLDDPIFIEHLLNNRLVDEDEYAAYISVWSSLQKRMPIPDAIICLEVPPAVSIQRITDAEVAGLRPAEFPSDEMKASWIESWADQYQKRIADLRSDPVFKERTAVFTHSSPYETIRMFVQDRLTSH